MTSEAQKPALAAGGRAIAKRIDVGELHRHVVPHLGSSSWRAITQADVTRFAVLTDDQQWIHVDPGRAATGPYGATVAHGFLTLGLFTGLLDEIVVVDGVKTVLNYGLNRVRFPAPVRVGGRLRLALGIDGVEQVRGGLQVVYKATFEVEGQDKPACVAEVVFRYYPGDVV